MITLLHASLDYPIESTLKSVTNPGFLHKRRQADPFLSRVKANLIREEIDGNDQNQRVHGNDPLGDNDISYYTPLARLSVLAIHLSLVSNLTPSIHHLNTHPRSLANSFIDFP